METDITPNEEKGEIVLYQPDDNVRLEVRLQDDTVWLTQQQMTELFKTTKQNVSLHINNIFREGELMSDSVVKESLTTAGDGKNGDKGQVPVTCYDQKEHQFMVSRWDDRRVMLYEWLEKIKYIHEQSEIFSFNDGEL